MLTEANSQPRFLRGVDGKAVFTVGIGDDRWYFPGSARKRAWIFLVRPVWSSWARHVQMCVGLVSDSDAGVAQFTDLIPIHKSASLRSTGSVAQRV